MVQEEWKAAKKAEGGVQLKILQRLAGLHGNDSLPSHDKRMFVNAVVARWEKLRKPTITFKSQMKICWRENGWFVFKQEAPAPTAAHKKVICRLTDEDHLVWSLGCAGRVVRDRVVWDGHPSRGSCLVC